MTRDRPSSAISLFTAAATAVVLVVSIIGMVLGWVPWYVGLLWCGGLAVVLVANLWAGLGRY